MIQVAVLQPRLFPSVTQFGNRYCDGKKKLIGGREVFSIKSLAWFNSSTRITSSVSTCRCPTSVALQTWMSSPYCCRSAAWFAGSSKRFSSYDHILWALKIEGAWSTPCKAAMHGVAWPGWGDQWKPRDEGEEKGGRKRGSQGSCWYLNKKWQKLFWFWRTRAVKSFFSAQLKHEPWTTRVWTSGPAFFSGSLLQLKPSWRQYRITSG